MADGAVNFLLDKLTTILMQEASLLGDSQCEVEAIKLELESMRSFIRDAERKKAKSESIETWVRQVREVAQKVEDVVDEFIYHGEMSQETKGLKHVFQDIIKLPKHMTARRKMSLELQKLKAEVHEVFERSKRYTFNDKIDEGVGRNASIDWWQRHEDVSIFVDEDEIVGMDESTENLLEWLTEDDPRRTIISIVGMGGLGKTTLVTKVYNDPVIQRLFDCWAWISVSETNGIEELLKCMVKELFNAKQVMIPRNLGSMNYRQLVEMLIHYLHQKRIIFTTRNENVATSVGPGSRVFRLEPLQDDDAWALFCKKAFWSDPDRSCPGELQALALAIMRKCEGLPLAIVAIGGLMCSKNRSAVEWRKVYDSLNWQLSNNIMLEGVKGILLLSFNDLPFYLKHCFLYCCVFHDGYPIKRKKLIRLWVAEGFVLERKGVTMEEVAQDYLMELIFRNMIQVIETNDAGRVKMFRVHDVMRELAVTTSEKENFCGIYDGKEARLEGKIQRLSLHTRSGSIRLSRALSRHLRSLFVFETEVYSSSFSLNALSSGFKLLRVLDLQGVSIEAIPGALVDLFNLRYLNLRATKVRELPKLMYRLRNLQTLDVRNTNVEKLPNGISDLPKLRHLFLRRNMDMNAETSNLGCGLRSPAGIGKARSLQTLTCIEADEELIQQVGNLADLRRLDVTKLRTIHGPMLCFAIEKMTTLHRLSLMASTEQEELRLEALALPPSFLQKLKLVGKLNKLPRWLGTLVNLTHLCLCSSHLQEDILSSIHSLPTLVLLELKKAYMGKLLHFKAGGFPRLNKLSLLELIEVNCLRIEEGALPSIRDLSLFRCRDLKTLPQGMKNLACLQKLHLEEMPEEFVQRLQRDASINTIGLVLIRDQKRVVQTLL